MICLTTRQRLWCVAAVAAVQGTIWAGAVRGAEAGGAVRWPLVGYSVPKGQFTTEEMPALKRIADAGIDITGIRLGNCLNSLLS